MKIIPRTEKSPIAPEQQAEAVADWVICEELVGRFKGLATLCHSGAQKLTFSINGVASAKDVCHALQLRLNQIKRDLDELRPPDKIILQSRPTTATEIKQPPTPYRTG